jgi:uncharacterized protein (TIGR02996 family)
MNPEAAFLEDILDHPDDDTPRLVYADWLTDRGGRGDDARAELIRVQCLHARLLGVEPRRRQLAQRAAELLRLFAADWLPAEWRSLNYGTWQRGFFHVQTRLWPFLDLGETWFHYPAVLDAELTIRGTGHGGLLTMDEEHLHILQATPLLARVTHLSVRGTRHPDNPTCGDDIARAIARSPYARRLRSLDLSCLSDAGAKALIESPHLTALEVVTMWACVELSPAVAERLAKRFQPSRARFSR